MAWAMLLMGTMASGAAAQRGGRTMRGGRGSRGGSGASGMVGDPAPELKAADVARINPIAMLLDRRQVLALTDTQVARLGAMLGDLRQRNAPHLAALDSVLAQIRLHATDSTGSEGDRLMRTGNDRSSFTAVLGRIRDNDDAAALEAMDLFTGVQLRRAYNVVREQRTIMGAVVRGATIPERDPPPPIPDTHS